MKSLDRFIEEAAKSVAPKSCPPGQYYCFDDKNTNFTIHGNEISDSQSYFKIGFEIKNLTKLKILERMKTTTGL